MINNTPDQEITLESTKAAFDQWRASKLSQSERIPQYLWDMVEFLRWEYSDYEMRQALGVTLDQINRHCSHPNNDQNSPEIVADDLMQIQPQIPVTECNLKIQHRDGHRMMITSTESFAFSAIKVFINGDA